MLLVEQVASEITVAGSNFCKPSSASPYQHFDFKDLTQISSSYREASSKATSASSFLQFYISGRFSGCWTSGLRKRRLSFDGGIEQF